MIGSEAPFDTDQLLLPTADIFYNHFLYLDREARWLRQDLRRTR
jgi:hypothetical protein